MLARWIVLAVLAFAAASLGAGGALPHDNGQFGDVPDGVRAWFRSVQSPRGVPCCDIADGHRTTWRAGADGGYEVPIEGTWVAVPPESIVSGAGNPTGEAVVWYSRIGAILSGDDVASIVIRCFVPGGGA